MFVIFHALQVEKEIKELKSPCDCRYSAEYALLHFFSKSEIKKIYEPC
jgi:hypothetical protein